MIGSFLKAFQEIVYVERYAASDGLLQRIDPRVKLCSVAALIFSAVAVRTLIPLAILLVAVAAVCIASKIPLKFFFLRTTIFIPIFAGVIALPLPFITLGTPLATVGYGDFILTVTREGAYRAGQFTLRVWTCVALSILLMLTTRFSKLIQAMENFRFPKVFVTMMAVTYRFIFLFINETFRMALAKESRTVTRLRWKGNVKSLANMIATLFIRAHERGERVYLAMVARGYAGTIRSPNTMKYVQRDWVFACLSILLCLTVLSVEYLHLGGL